MTTRAEPGEVSVGALTFDVLSAGPTSGPLVVLLHGFPQTMLAWQRQLPALAAAGFRVLAVNQRGYSPRARPAEVASYAMPHLVGDVLGLADALRADRFCVVGHDWGGMVAWFLAARHPDRIASMVSVSTPHPGALAHALRTTLDQRRRSSYVPLFRSRRAGRLFLAGGGAGLRLLFALSGLPPAQARPYVRAMREPGTLQAALNWYRANDFAGLAQLPAVTVPTMYVWSDRDSALGPSAARATGDQVSGPYRFEILHRVPHWVPERAPDQLNRLLLEHLPSTTPP